MASLTIWCALCCFHLSIGKQCMAPLNDLHPLQAAALLQQHLVHAAVHLLLCAHQPLTAARQHKPKDQGLAISAVMAEVAQQASPQRTP